MLGDRFDDLLDAARAGDQDAFAEIWREHHPGLLRYLRVVDRVIAEDIAAETWLHVTRGLGRLTGDEDGFRAWLFTIARRRHLDAHRAAGRRPPTTDAEETLAEMAGAASTAADVDERIATEAALRLIAALPPDQSEVVALRVIADLDVAQVARLVKKRPGTVRVLAHRGLRRLAEMMGDADDL